MAGAFVMQPTPMAVAPDVPEAHALTASLREALHQAPPRRVVLSLLGSQQPAGLGHITHTQQMQESLNDVPFPITVVRAGVFIEHTRGARSWMPARPACA